MLLSAVSVLVVAQSGSEIPEGLMNNPVYSHPVNYFVPSSSCVVIVLCFADNFIGLQCLAVQPPNFFYQFIITGTQHRYQQSLHETEDLLRS